MWYSVTQRIRSVQQPRGGYIPSKNMTKTELDDTKVGIKKKLNERENIQPVSMGLVVDYLTRFMISHNAVESFKISLLGAMIVHEKKYAVCELSKIKGLDDESIKAACKLVGFDVYFRTGNTGWNKNYGCLPDPDKNTIENIRIMVNRSIQFFEEYGPLVVDGFTFEGGYTSIIGSGDGDFITEDTLWDFKVSKNNPTSAHTLQLFIYWRMGLHSIHKEIFEKIQYLGIYNPRLNIVYRISVTDIPLEYVEEVDSEVIGY